MVHCVGADAKTFDQLTNTVSILPVLSAQRHSDPHLHIVAWPVLVWCWIISTIVFGEVVFYGKVKRKKIFLNQQSRYSGMHTHAAYHSECSNQLYPGADVQQYDGS